MAFVALSLFQRRDLHPVEPPAGFVPPTLASIVITELRLMLTTESASSYEW